MSDQYNNVVYYTSPFAPGSNVRQSVQDMGQGAADRINSWSGWTADPYPNVAPQTTVLWRTEDFEVLTDGIGNPPGGGAVSGGSNALRLDN